MTNPFIKVVNESASKITKVDESQKKFIEFLSMASESLNTIDGKDNVSLTNVRPELSANDLLMLLDGREGKLGFIRVYLKQKTTNKGFIAGAVTIDDESKALTLELGKLKIAYDITDEGMFECISEILKSPNFMERVIAYKNSVAN